jgi:predicted nucleic acid-binding protein
MAEVRRLELSSEVKDRELVLDSNILIYRYWRKRYTSPRWIREYSNQIRQLSKDGYRLSVDLLVISESINVASSEARRELQQTNHNLYYKDQKEFRDSAEGVVIMGEIYRVVREEVLVDCELINTSLTVAEVQSICYAEPLDFVDKLLVLICKKRSSILVTNDGDFLGKPIDILSNNDSYAVPSSSE